jgi:hypothetical protein
MATRLTTICANHDATFESLARLHRLLNTLSVGIDMKLLLPLVQDASIAASKVVTGCANTTIVLSESAKVRMDIVRYARVLVERPDTSRVPVTKSGKYPRNALKDTCKDTPEGVDCKRVMGTNYTFNGTRGCPSLRSSIRVWRRFVKFTLLQLKL